MGSEAVPIRHRVLELLADRSDITPAILGAYTNLSQSTVSKFLSSGVEFGRRVELEFERVIRQIENGDILLPSSDSIELTEEPSYPRPIRRSRDFYRIKSVQRIEQMLTHCAEHGVIGVTTGEYGVGKTEAIRRWLANQGSGRNAMVFEFDEFSAHAVVDFVNQLAGRFDLRVDRSPRGAGDTMRAICEAINQQDKPLLLIFDQCETCSPRVLQVIRQIWDKTCHFGTGVAMFASPLLLTRLHESRMKDVGALSSRVAVWVQIHGVLREETAEILKKEGVSDIEQTAIDLLWRASAGSMRRLMAASDLLVLKHAGKKITERTIEGVASHLWGLDIGNARRVVR